MSAFFMRSGFLIWNKIEFGFDFEAFRRILRYRDETVDKFSFCGYTDTEIQLNVCCARSSAVVCDRWLSGLTAGEQTDVSADHLGSSVTVRVFLFIIGGFL